MDRSARIKNSLKATGIGCTLVVLAGMFACAAWDMTVDPPPASVEVICADAHEAADVTITSEGPANAIPVIDRVWVQAISPNGDLETTDVTASSRRLMGDGDTLEPHKALLYRVPLPVTRPDATVQVVLEGKISGPIPLFTDTFVRYSSDISVASPNTCAGHRVAGRNGPKSPDFRSRRGLVVA